MPDQGWRLALPRARHDRHVRHHVGVLDLRDRLSQQVVRDGEVEQRLARALEQDSNLTPASGIVQMKGFSL